MRTPIPSPVPMLRRATSLLARALLVCVLATVQVMADEAPVLREQIRVHSDIVTLGDIFDNAGPVAGAAVFRSPDLGTRGFVAAKRVAEAARRHGLYWDNPGGVAKVSIERPSRVVTLEEISRAIARHAMSEFGLTSTEDISVELDRLSRRFHVDPRIAAPLAVKRLSMRAGGGAFDAVLALSDPEYGATEKRYRGRIHETVSVAVPAHPIERGQTIGEGDVKTVRMPRSLVPAGIVMEAGALAGMAAKRNLRLDQPVRRADLERPRLVTRNALVTIVYEIPGLALKSQGRAMDDAALGQTVAVENTRSKRTVHAIVRGPGLVAVAPNRAHNAPRVAANAKPAGRSSARKGPHSVR